MTKRIITFILLSFYFLTVCSIAVKARTALTVSPTRVELASPQGKTTKVAITVSNAGDELCKVRCYTMDYIKKLDGDVKLLSAGQSRWSCAKWIKLNPVEFNLKTGETKNVRCYLKIPPNVSSGRYWAVALFETTATKGKGVAVSGRVGTIVSLRVTPSQANSSSQLSPWIYILVAALGAIALLATIWQSYMKRFKRE